MCRPCAASLTGTRFGADIFGNPIQTSSGSQRAIFDAYAIHAELEAETLRVEAAVRTQWYRLYVLEKQIEIALANQELLQSLIDVAKAKAWPVVGGMTVELLTLFVVPVVIAAFKEFKMNLGMHDRHWAGKEEA
ncbi:hypothetical protein [Blastopirellula marina]|uniref:hypothetical protein n=1 Tax=Blastopirellula marina TaxID=124 RepID=UPI0011B0C3DD|nr:hypothetical protein [Blastopirellula marina]